MVTFGNKFQYECKYVYLNCYSSNLFLISRKLNAHSVQAHNIRNFVCKECGKEFGSQWIFRNHLNYAHTDREPEQCETCGKICKDLKALIEHRRCHNEEFKYMCNICGMAYRNRASLYNHRTDKHSENGKKTHECKVCGRQFLMKSSLQQHIFLETHVTDEQKLPKLYTCEICEKQFGAVACLTKHKKVMHTEKALSCEYCGKPFACQSNLRQHRWTHTGKRPSCGMCGLIFRSQKKLTEHMTQAHAMNVGT